MPGQSGANVACHLAMADNPEQHNLKASSNRGNRIIRSDDAVDAADG
jgi:hypothetical protein